MKKYTVQLDGQQRTLLESMLSGGKASAQSQTHARILLKADEGTQGAAWTDEQIAEALEVGRATVERVRRRFGEGGMLDALVRRPQPERPEKRTMDGELEARLVTLACSQTEAGHERWTVRRLSEKLVQLGYVDQISHQTVWVTLKKRTQTVVREAILYSTGSQRRLCLSLGRHKRSKDALRLRSGCVWLQDNADCIWL